MKFSTLYNSNVTLTDASPNFSLSCDILVVGAGAGGIFTAVTAAEEGRDVILLENDINIGGMRVRGNVTPYYYGAPGGSFEKIDKETVMMNEFAFCKKQPEPLQIKLTELIRKSGVRLITDSAPIGIYFDGNKAAGIKALIKQVPTDISAKLTVDATSDGHLIRMSGVKYTFGRERDGKVAPFTVRTQYINEGKYISINDDSGYINQYDEKKFSKSIIRAHANAEKFLPRGEFLSLPTQAGIREGLSFIGKEVLRYTDLCLGRFTKKPMFYAYADLDKHGHDRALDDEIYQTWMTVANLATVTVNIPVPFGSVIPLGISGLITAGRCLSIDTYALGAVRMNRDMYRMGECIGVAASMAVEKGVEIDAIDYEVYLERVKLRGCFNGYPDRTFGFDNNRNLISYKPLDFNTDKTLDLLYTETPGAAIWSCYISKNKSGVCQKVYEMMKHSDSELAKYNCAIALGVMGDSRALPVIREIVKKRDCYYYKDCRRSNQHRSAIAICLLGRIGTKDDIAALSEIVFDKSEIDKELYHVLKPEYIHHIEGDRNFLFFDIFTHAVMALVKIYKRLKLSTDTLANKFTELFTDETTVSRITDANCDEPAYIEVTEFFKSVLEEIKS